MKGERNAAAARTADTERAYLDRARRLLAAWRGAGGGEDDPAGFAAWLASRAADLRASSFRQYRAAAIFAMPRLFGDRPETWRAVATLARPRPPRRRHLPPRSSALKLRHLPREDWLALETHLRRRAVAEGRAGGVVPAGLLLAWCRATLITGLRPCEWEGAICETGLDPPRLVVRNAKRTHGRAHGPTRTLLLPGADRATLAELDLVCRTARRWAAAGRGETLRRRLACRLRREARRVLGEGRRLPSLYTLRHQAIANWKDVHDGIEVAALAGHAVTRTAGRHYAGRRRAWRRPAPPPVRPSAADLAAVRGPKPAARPPAGTSATAP